MNGSQDSIDLNSSKKSVKARKNTVPIQTSDHIYDQINSRTIPVGPQSSKIKVTDQGSQDARDKQLIFIESINKSFYGICAKEQAKSVTKQTSFRAVANREMGEKATNVFNAM